jgi:hypothetical protein
MTRAGRAAIEAAIVRFRKATELDPSYVQAWAQLAICYNELITFPWLLRIWWRKPGTRPDAPMLWIRTCQS